MSEYKYPAARNIRCKCGHILYTHSPSKGNPTKCMACDCSEFVDENDKTVITIEHHDMDRGSSNR